MTSVDSDPARDSPPIRTRGFQIHLDEGRESFFALCMEERANSDTAWLMSDTVHSLDEMR